MADMHPTKSSGGNWAIRPQTVQQMTFTEQQHRWQALCNSVKLSKGLTSQEVLVPLQARCQEGVERCR